MAQAEQHFIIRGSFLRLMVFLMLGSTTLVVTINSYDSGIAKPFLLTLFAGMAAASFIGRAIWSGTLVIRKSLTDAPVLLFLILIILSAITTAHTWNAEQALPVWISFIICFFAGTQLFTTDRDFDKLMRVTAVIASIVCALGLVQFFFPATLGLEFFIGKDLRISSTLTNALYLGGYIVLLFPSLLAFTVASERTARERWMLGILLSGLAFLLVATSTRSSLAAFLVSVPMFVFLSRGMRNKLLLLGVLVAVAGAIYLSPQLIERIEAPFRSDSNTTLARREYFWKAGFEAVRNAPFFGHGIGSYEKVMLDYRSPEYWTVKSEDLVPHAHNELVETAVDLGSVGVIVYIIIVATVFVAGMRPGPKNNAQDRLVRAGLVCSLVAIFIDNLANMSLRVVPVGAYAWLFMGILASHRNRKDAPAEINLRLPKAVGVFVLLVWMAFTILYCRQQFRAYQSDGHIIRAIFNDRAGDMLSAIKEYQSALAWDPHNLIARSNLALTFLKAGRVKESLDAARQLEGLSPHYPKCNLVQAATLIYLRRYSEALQKIDTELTLRTHPDAYYYQSIAHNGLGNASGELDAIEHVLLSCIKGKVPYQSESVAMRVRALVRSEDDITRFTMLYNQLHLLFPHDTTVTAMATELSTHKAK